MRPKEKKQSKRHKLGSRLLLMGLSVIAFSGGKGYGNCFSGTFEVFGEALYWYTSETLDWAFTLTSDANSVNASYKTFVFDWAPGARGGLRYTNDCTYWDTSITYTWFESEAKESTQGAVTPAFLGARLSLLEPFATGAAELDLRYNILDWDLGYTFCPCFCMRLRPYIGLKGGWITQEVDSRWTGEDLFGTFFRASEDLKQHFSGVGPKGGLRGDWDFNCCGLSLIGQLETGYLWGHWKIRDQFTDSFNTTIDVNTCDRDFGALVLHSFFGFGWDYGFSCVTMKLELGYEIQDWFNHVQFFTDASGSQSNDLILQGFKLHLGLSF